MVFFIGNFESNKLKTCLDEYSTPFKMHVLDELVAKDKEFLRAFFCFFGKLSA